jgi:purine-binding chemotaxis protein CheW
MTWAPFFHFRTGGTRYCVNVRHVEMVSSLPALSGVDGGPVWLTGLLNLQGKNVPTIDFSRFVGHEARPFSLAQKILVLTCEKKCVALIVDEVDGLMEASSSNDETLEIWPLPTFQDTLAQEKNGVSDAFLGQVQLGDAWVTVVDAEKLTDIPQSWPAHGLHALLPGALDPTLSAQVFMSRMHKLASTPLRPNTQAHVQLAIVLTDSRRYAIGLEHIVAFAKLGHCTWLPGTPDCIVGCMNWRGEILAIVNLDALSGCKASPHCNHVVVLQHQGHRFACLIASIHRMMSVDETHVVNLRESETMHALATTLVLDGDDVTPILHLESLLTWCANAQPIHHDI